MSGGRKPHGFGVRVDEREEQGGGSPALQLLDEAVHALEDQRWPKPFQRVCPNRALKVRHAGRGFDAPPDDVADHQRDAPIPQGNGVVPVATDARLPGTR